MYLYIDRWMEGRINGAWTDGLTDVRVGGDLGWLDGVCLGIDRDYFCFTDKNF